MIVVNSRFLTQHITGVQRFAIELSVRLKKLDSSIVFVCPKGIILEDIAKNLDVKIIGSNKGHLWEQLDLPMWLKKNGNPLLLNLANTAPLLYSNSVVTIHDVAFEVFPESFSKSFLLWYKFLIPRISRKSRKIITVSNFSKAEIVKYYRVAESKVRVVYNSVDLDKWEKTRIQGINNTERYFLAVSSLSYRKNFLYILRAFSKYLNTDNNAKLYIVGDLKTNSFGKVDLSEYLNNPSIKFLGRVSDKQLVSLYTNAYCFIYPSIYEGFGLPPLEAQYCGCPSICSSESCLPEIFTDSVLYCDPYKDDTLVKCMQEIRDENIRVALQQKGEENLLKYSWDKSVQVLFDELLELEK